MNDHKVVWNITWDQFAEIRLLTVKCFDWDINGKEIWNDEIWIAGLKKIVGEELVNSSIGKDVMVKCH